MLHTRKMLDILRNAQAIHLRDPEETPDTNHISNPEAPKASSPVCRRSHCFLVTRPHEAVDQIHQLCDQWLQTETLTKQQMIDQLMLEQFLSTMPKEIQTWVMSKQPKNSREASILLANLVLVPGEEGSPAQEMSPEEKMETEEEQTQNAAMSDSLPSPGPQELVTFEDVTIEFSPEELSYLSASQRVLYQEVMLENYQNLVFIGNQFPKPDIISLLERKSKAMEEDSNRALQRNQFPRPEIISHLEEEEPQAMEEDNNRVTIKRESSDDPLEPQQDNQEEQVLSPVTESDTGTFPEEGGLGGEEDEERSDLSSPQGMEPLETSTPGTSASPEPMEPIRCSVCQRVFKTQAGLRMHESFHLGIRPFKCSHCDTAFFLKPHLNRHLRSHYVTSLPSSLGNQFPRPEIISHLEEEEPQAMEEDSNRVTIKRESSDDPWEPQQDSQEELVLSPVTESDTGTFPEEGGLGGEEDEERSDLSSPQGMEPLETSTPGTSASPEPMEPIRCSVCQRVFKTQADLRRHESFHLGIRPFKCSHCDTAFFLKPHLNRHLKSHHGERPEECNVACKSPWVGDKSQAEFYECLECGKAFIHRVHLSQHVRAHELTKSLSPAMHRRTHVIRYQRKHGYVGERACQCCDCGRAFSQSSYLVQHCGVHAHDIPYQCQLCGMCFTNPSHLTQHYQLNPPEIPFGGELNFEIRNKYEFPEFSDTIPCIFNGNQFPRPEIISHLEEEEPQAMEEDNNRVTIKRESSDDPWEPQQDSQEELVLSPVTESDTGTFPEEGGLGGEEDEECSDLSSPQGMEPLNTSTPGTSASPEPMEPIRCSVCQRVFKTQADLRMHESFHLGIRPFKCSHCDAAFFLKPHLNRHLKSHYGNQFPRPEIISHLEEEEPQAMEEDNNRVTIKRESSDDPWEPQQDSQEELVLSPVTESDTGTFPEEGGHGGEEDEERSDLSSPQGMEPLETSTPGTSASPEPMEPIRCSVCQRVFKTQAGLRRHESFHLGIRPFKCSHCDAAFFLKPHLNRHLRSHYGESSEDPWEPQQDIQEEQVLSPVTESDTGTFPEEGGHGGESSDDPLEPQQDNQEEQVLSPVTESDTGTFPEEGGLGGEEDEERSDLSSPQGMEPLETSTPGTSASPEPMEPIRCSVCQRVFKTQAGLRMHESFHLGIRPFKCSHCDTAFFLKPHLNRHLRSHYGNQFPRPEIISHLEEEEPQAMEEDNRVTIKRESSDDPLEPQQDNQEEQVLSPVTESDTGTFPEEGGLGGEEDEERSDLSSPQGMEPLDTSTPGTSASPEPMEPIRCSVCQRVFKTQAGLRMHESFHLGIRPFKCSHCDEAFFLKPHLNRHLKSHHGNQFPRPEIISHLEEEEPQAMEEDSNRITIKTFFLKPHLNRHLSHYGERPKGCNVGKKPSPKLAQIPGSVTSKGQAKFYECFECGKAFIHEVHLSQHLRAHELAKSLSPAMHHRTHVIRYQRKHGYVGERACQCCDCGRAFSQSSYLVQHYRIHAHDIPYQCQLCGKCFSHPSHLTQHYQLHPPEIPVGGS
ncbi:zinc finger protein Xfin [Nannospalax galili]|uniref:zinc finger protein Xfin n=1 Tax=Nannospalax galili TaxID=1026970 RepID=UPI00111C5F74|nr:zinc finger protein Xfin [Nannospalax galili]